METRFTAHHFEACLAKELAIHAETRNTVRNAKFLPVFWNIFDLTISINTGWHTNRITEINKR